jgi:tryptophan-rich sensory protein
MTGIASRSQLRMSFLRYALVTVPLVLLLGTVSGTVAGSGYGNPWFDALAKPGLMPPGWVFGAAWTLLYICLGLALALILHARGARGRKVAIGIFLAQLLLNYAWSPIFFAAHEVGLAFIVIVLMIILSAARPCFSPGSAAPPASLWCPISSGSSSPPSSPGRSGN